MSASPSTAEALDSAAVRMAVATEAGNLVEADSYRALGRNLLAPSSPRLLAIA